MSTSSDPKKIDQNDERGIRWSEDITQEHIQGVLKAEFSEYEGTHKDHSCEGVGSDENGDYLLKDKERNFATEQTEFDSLTMWNEILEFYDKEYDTGISSPTPYCHTEKEGVVMEIINGQDWEPLDYVRSNDHGNDIINNKDEARNVANKVGSLAKIMENEGLIHGDIAKRHLLINKKNQDLGVIDVEGISRADNNHEVAKEVYQLRETLDHLSSMKGYGESEVSDWFQEGYDTIPEDANSGVLDSYGFDGFEESYDFEKLGNSIETVFN